MMVVTPLLRVFLVWVYMNLISWITLGWILAEQWSSVWVVILMVMTILPAGIFYDHPRSPKPTFPSPL